jgi:Asp-tRNA(Asn)/Glu-tRNA(Gln) amidotransferase A subunit family amidase
MSPKSTPLTRRLTEFEAFYATKEPRIHAFLPEEKRFKRLQREAAALEKRFRKQKNKPPLFGLLLGVKDMFHADGFETHAGSRLPARALTGKEAESVKLLKKAGMLVAGKTVTTEFAYFAPGPTRNPHDLDATPGGSSSGSAAAVAAGLVDVALGTQTIGSVIRPASFCGVVGFKPTHGRISTAGVIPLAPTFDDVGIFAQSLALVRQTAAVICKDWKTLKISDAKPSLAVAGGDYLQRASAEMRANFEHNVERLRAAGYNVRIMDPLRGLPDIIERHNLIVAAEAAHTHSSWFEKYKPLYNERTADLIVRGQNTSDADLQSAREAARSFGLTISTLMEINGIDLWLSPSALGAAPEGLASTGDPIMNLPWTHAGMPTLGLPAGFDVHRMPLGLQITADRNKDEMLIAWATEIERVLGAAA